MHYAHALTILVVCIVASVNSLQHSTLTSTEWTDYMTQYGKMYASRSLETYALFNYNYNRKLVARHNALYDQGLRTYKLAVNQFSDLRLASFYTMFPPATPLSMDYASDRPSASLPPDSYDPSQFGFSVAVPDQGVVCNSGWAYATANAIALRLASISLSPPSEPLSAQTLIDCAGMSRGCRNQVPQNAFDYLTQFDRLLYWETDYPNNNTQAQQGMCLPPSTVANMAEVRVAQYSTIPDGNDVLLKQYVGNGFPVVVEFNPTSFEFMHYSEGIFQQPRTGRGSHFMTVVGYGTDTASTTTGGSTTQNRDYWRLVNSFGSTWGEGGLMRFARTASTPMAKSAIFPTIFATTL